MKKFKTAFAGFIAAVLLAGCAGSSAATSVFSPETSSIFVTREGAVSSAIVESYEEKDYYSEEGLKAFAQESVDAYNQAAGTDKAVALKSCSMKDGKASLVFEYGSGNDLVQFAKEYEDAANQVQSLEVSTVADALAKGKLKDVTYVDVKKKAPASADAATSDGALHAVEVEGAVTLQTEGRVVYTSENVTLADDFTAQTPEGKSYIIFR